MAPPSPTRALGRAGPWLGTIATVAALYFGREILVPIAVSGLFAFLLSPFAARLERLHFPRGISAVVAVMAFTGVVGAALWIVAGEAIKLSDKLPEHRVNIQRKLAALESGSLGGPMTTLDRLEHDLTTSAPTDGSPKPMLVEMAREKPSAWGSVGEVAGPAVPILGGILVVLVLTIFLITYRADLQDRMIRLVSKQEIVLTTQALDEASRGVSRYLGTALLVNVIFAVPIVLGLWLLGVPNAPLWGFVAVVLRFVPILGVWMAAAFPLALSVAEFDGWWQTGAVFGLFAVVDVVIGNVVEPLVYGKRTGVSPVAVIVAMLFWTWLWGIPGLLLAVPVTLCLAILGRHVPALGFLDALLGSGHSLSPSQRVYQRLVALDPESARTILEEHVKKDGDSPTLDGIAFPALAAASVDRTRGVLADETFAALCAAMRDVLDELGSPVEETKDASSVVKAASEKAGPVLLVPVSDPADAVVCETLASRLARQGIAAEVASTAALAGELAERVLKRTPAAVVLAGLPPFASGRIRYLAKRLRPVVPENRLLVAVWSPDGEGQGDALAAGVDHVIARMADAIDQVRALVLTMGAPDAPAPEDARGIEVDDAARAVARESQR